MLETMFDTLFQSQQLNPHVSDLAKRTMGLELGIVTDTDDPENLRRIKVATASKGGQVNTFWCLRILQSPYDDPPMPPVGMTALIGFLEGDPHAPFYLGVLCNEINPALGKGQIVEDGYDVVPGDRLQKTDRTHTIRSGDDLTIHGEAVTHHYPKLILEEKIRLPLNVGAERFCLWIVRGIPGVSPDRIITLLNNGNGVPQSVIVASGDPYNPLAPIVPDTYTGYPDNGKDT